MKKFVILLLLSIVSFTFLCQNMMADTKLASITQAKDFSKTTKNRKQVFINTLVPIIDEIKGNIKRIRREWKKF
ncbi:Uncharacterised protein [Fusobacterium necrophorum subsp. necrophorum]|nr:Uncharacterised protein [Fusobacterium necrophorum subsp. necrophorum]